MNRGMSDSEEDERQQWVKFYMEMYETTSRRLEQLYDQQIYLQEQQEGIRRILERFMPHPSSSSSDGGGGGGITIQFMTTTTTAPATRGRGGGVTTMDFAQLLGGLFGESVPIVPSAQEIEAATQTHVFGR